MNTATESALAQSILAETERTPAARKTASLKPIGPCPEKLQGARDILDTARSKGKLALAYSGGTDSTVLLDLMAQAKLETVLVWTDTGMEYPETREFIERQAGRYGMRLAIARPRRTPEVQWRESGWPMLGKMAARNWTRANRNAGFKLNVSECCRTMKIRPGRLLTKNLGFAVQVTGQRGKVDDRVRAYRAWCDGAVSWQNRDRLWIANPLTSWTDEDVEGYTAARSLERHPAIARGAQTIGCVFCGGGCQFENSGYRILRTTWPEAWRQFVVGWGGGMVILALKYGARLEEVQAAVRELGGLGQLAETRPWIFDYTRVTPLRGYEKGKTALRRAS